MHLLVVGTNGLLGSNVVSAGHRRNWDVSGTYHLTQPNFDIPLEQFDLRTHDRFDGILDEHEPDVVVNCAAMTDVDGCETDPERAHVLNGEAPGALAAACEGRGIDFVHISTDYVFDGSERDPYEEPAETNPIQEYGASKAAGERAVRNESDSALMARLSFVWGVHRNTGNLTGFPAWVRDQLAATETVPLFTDQRVTPTRAGQAAETLLELIERDATGLYHVACRSCVSPYEFGALLAEYSDGGPELLAEGSMEGVDREAPRPSYTCLDVEKLETTLERSQPTLREELDTDTVHDSL